MINSIIKNVDENNCGNVSNFAIASGYATKANPVSPFTTDDMSSVPTSCAKFPNIPNIIIPEVNDVIVSTIVIVAATLYNYKKKKNQMSN